MPKWAIGSEHKMMSLRRKDRGLIVERREMMGSACSCSVDCSVDRIDRLYFDDKLSAYN
jgi:hypothetical protein